MVARKTLSSMHDARDAEDKRLLEAGDHKLLLAGYFVHVRELCFLRLRDRRLADEAAQQVFVRLLAELRGGKTYTVPFRVVIWNVVGWTCAGLHRGAKEGSSLPDDWDPTGPDAYEGWEDEHDFGLLIAELPDRQHEVLDLVYREGLSPAQVAERLGIKRNAVDQALHNGHRKLAEKIVA
jgi:RNA polymerase sigma factor (sigma-70 family)